jgi:hypothetical protein
MTTSTQNNTLADKMDEIDRRAFLVGLHLDTTLLSRNNMDYYGLRIAAVTLACLPPPTKLCLCIGNGVPVDADNIYLWPEMSIAS